MSALRKTRGTIVSGLPVPPRDRGSVYPFEDMAVGDCLFLEANESETPRTHWRVASSARYHGLRLGFTFTVRMMDDGVRVWRTA